MAAYLALAPLGVSAQQAAPTANKDVSIPRSMILELAGEIEGMQGRQMRLRFVRFEPGGHTGIHSHKDRPEGVYVIQGTLTNYQDGQVSVKKAGDTWVAGKDVTHWTQNNGNEPVVLMVVDIFKN